MPTCLLKALLITLNFPSVHTGCKEILSAGISFQKVCNFGRYQLDLTNSAWISLTLAYAVLAHVFLHRVRTVDLVPNSLH